VRESFWLTRGASGDVNGQRGVETAPNRYWSIFKAWLPVLLWMALIFFFSTSFGTMHNNIRLFKPMIRGVMPEAHRATIRIIVATMRDSAHFFNYSVLFFLLIVGPFRGRPYAALFVCLGYACSDEFHQAFVPQRICSPKDVALDTSGAMLGAVLHTISQLRDASNAQEALASLVPAFSRSGSRMDG
jgi:VanZ family protein